jgi:hypothetical protein
MKNKALHLVVLLLSVLLISANVRAGPLDASSTATQAVGFTNASLQGNYAITGFVGANVGAIVGVCHFDGDGHYNCLFTGNDLGENNTRVVTPNVSNKGEYYVHPDGTGTMREHETVNGVTNDYDDNFVILHAEAIGSYLVAHEVYGLVGNQTNPSGALYTWQLYRLPDTAIVPIPAAEPTAESTAAPTAEPTAKPTANN